MAEEAFALSPISARPNVPGEADYDAIREAFMETARGRWFLNEYAKRNRHTDTGMVLEAVTRLEASLKAQKQAPAIGLLESLAAIRSAVRHAKASAIEAMPRSETDETQTAARNGARIIREIASTMRECGADVRICDLLDTQVRAIDAAQQAAAHTGRDDVLASYDLLMQRIEALVDGSAPVAQHAEAPVAEKPVQPTAEVREASVTPLFKAPAAEAVAEVVLPVDPEVVSAVEAQAPAPAVAETSAAIVESTAEIAATMEEASAASIIEEIASAEPAATLEAENAHDLAVLDMVALEMAVLDPIEPEVIEPEMVQPEMAPPAPQPEMIAPEVIEAPVSFAQIAEVSLAPEHAQPEPVVQAAPQPEPEASYQPSLGAALIANGVISNPNAPASDPLAPIRRMSQAEKIAFFS